MTQNKITENDYRFSRAPISHPVSCRNPLLNLKKKKTKNKNKNKNKNKTKLLLSLKCFLLNINLDKQMNNKISQIKEGKQNQTRNDELKIRLIFYLISFICLSKSGQISLLPRFLELASFLLVPVRLENQENGGRNQQNQEIQVQNLFE